MSKLAHFKGEFEGWSEDRRRAFLTDLAPLIREHAVCGIASALDLDILANMQWSKDEATKYSVGFSFIWQVMALMDWGQGPTSYILDDLASSQGKTQINHAWFYLKRHPKLSALMNINIAADGITWAPSVSAPELQAADWLAYECGREYARRLGRESKLSDQRYSGKMVTKPDFGSAPFFCRIITDADLRAAGSGWLKGRPRSG